MDKQELTQLLQQVADGDVTPDDAALRLKVQPFQEIGAYAKVDFHRGIPSWGCRRSSSARARRRNTSSALPGRCCAAAMRTILITRLSAEAAAYLETDLPLHYDSAARVGIIGELAPPAARGASSSRPAAQVIFPSQRRQR